MLLQLLDRLQRKLDFLRNQVERSGMTQAVQDCGVNGLHVVHERCWDKVRLAFPLPFLLAINNSLPKLVCLHILGIGFIVDLDAVLLAHVLYLGFECCPYVHSRSHQVAGLEVPVGKSQEVRAWLDARSSRFADDGWHFAKVEISPSFGMLCTTIV
jgi:hypothetical protein